MTDKYRAEVSAQKIISRINNLLKNNPSSLLKKSWVINGFGGLQWNKRESDAIDFDQGFAYLSRSRVINFIDDETFEVTEYFDTFAPKFQAPPPLPIQIERQVENEAENMRNCYSWLYMFENTLRNFVFTSLKEEDGETWLDELSKPVRGEIKENKKKWMSEIPPRNSLELTMITTLGRIIGNKWNPIFKKRFKSLNPTSLKESLSRIEKFRNTIAHSRMLSEKESWIFYYEIGIVLSNIKTESSGNQKT